MIKQRFIVNADETIAPVNKIVELEPLADENGNPLNVAADVDYVEIRKECVLRSSSPLLIPQLQITLILNFT